MKISVDGDTIRIHGERDVDLVIYANTDKDRDRFSVSLSSAGIEHGGLFSVEVADGGNVVTYTCLDKGFQ